MTEAFHPPSSSFSIGASPVRLEDERFLRGQGRYVDDLPCADALCAVFVRSPHAHATISAIERDSVRGRPGVRAVLTASEAAADGLSGLVPLATNNPHNGEPFRYDTQPLLAADKVRYPGQPVALVIGDDSHAALDAAESLAVSYQALPSVTSPREALTPGAPQVAASVPGNLCLDFDLGDAKGVACAFASAAHVVTMDTVNHRVITNSMEPRGAIARFDAASESFRLDISSQNVHVLRDQIAASLGVPPDRIELVAPDVGGGFGNRNFIYPEYALLLWAAKRCAQPVKWISTRSEVFTADHPSRDFEASASLALDARGKFLALQVRSAANLGAYVAGSSCGVQTGQYTTAPTGLYDIPRVHLNIRAALTNTTPIGVTRGPGFAEAINVIERLIDRAATVTGIDRVTLRRRNLVPPDRMPWTNALGTVIDSGNFPACLESALQRAEAAQFAARREASAQRGMLRGLGLACHVKATGGLPEENVSFDFEPDRLVFTTGTMAIGQGHETTFRQMLGSLLGLLPEQIEYRAGHSGLIVMGGGHGSSRATYMAGLAMAKATEIVVQRGRRLLSTHWDVPREEVQFEAGWFRSLRTNQAMALLEAATLARGRAAPFDVYQHVVRDAMTFPNGCHVAEVEVDPETGQTSLLRYTAVDDYGVEVNPMIVAGQMSGAIAQGTGQALLEGAVFDERSGQLLSGSFMDYAMPRAGDLPSFDLQTAGKRCTTNPLGVKGCGEAGAVAGFPAIANAIADALSARGHVDITGPASPYRVWKLLEAR